MCMYKEYSDSLGFQTFLRHVRKKYMAENIVEFDVLSLVSSSGPWRGKQTRSYRSVI